jgi:hypothetical protein
MGISLAKRIRIINYIFIFIINIYGLSALAQQDDTLVTVADTAATVKAVIPKEIKSITPVNFNSETYQELKKDKNYAYYNLREEHSILNTIVEAFYRWLTKHFNPHISLGGAKIILWTIVVIVLIIIVVIIYFYKPSLFYFNRKKKRDFEIEDEDINATNFEKLIKESSDSGQYSDAIRWTYLLTLRELYKRELISWDTNTTVVEYVHELERSDLKPDFRELSQRFLYYRYGNFEASQDTFNSFTLLSNQIIKRL